MIENLPGVSLQPGQLYLARSPAILRTILGSCVGVTFWSARLRVGALCHGVLPRCPPHTTCKEGHRYVDFSIRYLAEEFDALGVARQELDIKLFGGADVLPVATAPPCRPTVGAMNCEAALAVLQAEGLRVGASDLGGTRGRTLRFHTGTGEVLLQRLNRLPGAGRRETGMAPAASRKSLFL
ncbi:MAG TPA: chemotaxis protein CheD [Bryobacteraceae bacterium]|nr:chemotaxis protein CheD [Bryobacteraceae bacterium]